MRFILPALAAAVSLQAADPLVFSFFRNNGEDGLYLASSEDGYLWRELNSGRPLLKPDVGESRLMRDPSIARGPGGLFHMVWTTSWQGKTIGYASSRDLRQWSAQRAIPIDLGGEVLNCWAPELFFDDRSQEFIIVWASTVKGRFPETLGKGTRDYNHRMYAMRTRDFTTFTPPKLFFDPGFQVIDAALFRWRKGYAMVAKNETQTPPAKYLFLSFADSLDGPWTPAGEAISGKDWAEGPSPARVGGFWHIYFDRYRDRRYGVIRSRDLKTWEDASARLSLPAGMRHGTVLHAPRRVVEGLR